jgi:hypothetical protein
MKAAEKAENHNYQKQFFEAITNNNLEIINKLVYDKLKIFNFYKLSN